MHACRPLHGSIAMETGVWVIICAMTPILQREDKGGGWNENRAGRGREEEEEEEGSSREEKRKQILFLEAAGREAFSDGR